MPRPPKISRDQVLDRAFRVACAEGAHAVTMRRLADDLAVDPMALYRHVRSKEELLDAIVERALREIRVPSNRTPWQARLARAVEAIVEFARAHPTLVPIMVARGYGSETGWAIVECVIGACEDAGLPPQRAAEAASIALNLSIGLCISLTSDGGRWNDETSVAAVVGGLDPAAFGASRRHAAALAKVERDTSGRSQVRFLAKAIEAMVAASVPPRPAAR